MINPLYRVDCSEANRDRVAFSAPSSEKPDISMKDWESRSEISKSVYSSVVSPLSADEAEHEICRDPGYAPDLEPRGPGTPRVPHQTGAFYGNIGPNGHKKALRVGGLRKGGLSSPYRTLVARLNLVVNFSTRPAVSTRRFSPV